MNDVFFRENENESNFFIDALVACTLIVDLTLPLIPQWLNHGSIKLSNSTVKLQMALFY